MSMFPIRCFTCNKVVGNKYHTYTKRVEDIPSEVEGEKRVQAYDKIWQDLGLRRNCCKQIFMTFRETPIPPEYGDDEKAAGKYITIYSQSLVKRVYKCV